MGDDPIMISGLQHFTFCRRQWALIHIEQQWADNLRTVEGNLMHKRAHEEKQIEKRGDQIIMRGMRVHSQRLGMTGICDVVEFHRDSRGVPLQEYDGLWLPYPVEYKRGKPKEHDADVLQLCAQAMCLEEMLLCSVPKGSLYYGEPHRRTEIVFSDEIRQTVASCIEEMRQYMLRGYTPRPRKKKGCNSCSLKEICLPQLNRSPSVAAYIGEHIGEADPCENC